MMTNHPHGVTTNVIAKVVAAGLFLTLMWVLLAATAFADIAPPQQPPGSSISPAEGTTQVRMQSEEIVLHVLRSNDEAVVEVRGEFIMLNTSDTAEQMQVRFPLMDPSGEGSGFGEYPEVQGFVASINGDVVETGVLTTTNPTGAEAPPVRWAVFDANFPPGEEVRIRVLYRVPGTGYPPEQQFTYILETGAGWKDTIGSVDVSVRLPYTATSENVLQNSEGQTTPGGRFDGNFIRWHWDDLEPTRESNVEVTVLAPVIWETVLDARYIVEANPDDADAWVMLARAYNEATTERYPIEQGDPFAFLSHEAYEHAIALQPDSAQLHADFGRLMWDQMAIQAFPEEGNEWIRRILNEVSAALYLDPQNETALELYEEMNNATSQSVPLGTPTLVPVLPMATPTTASTVTTEPTDEPAQSPTVPPTIDQPPATSTMVVETIPTPSIDEAVQPQTTIGATATTIPPQPSDEGSNSLLPWLALGAVGGIVLGAALTGLVIRRK